MERAKNLIFGLLLLLITIPASSTNHERIYMAYISNNMADWKLVIDEMALQQDIQLPQLLELINYQYGYIGYCLGTDKKQEAKAYLEKLRGNLDKIADQPQLSAYYHGYMSAAIGFEIGINILRAPFIGGRSVDNAKQAMLDDKNNPLGYIQYANAEYYKPAMIGGSKSTAIEYMELAKRIMEEEQQPTLPTWNYLSLVVQLAQAYSEGGELLKAKKMLDDLLIIEPNFLWVKNDIYPKLLEKLDQEK